MFKSGFGLLVKIQKKIYTSLRVLQNDELMPFVRLEVEVACCSETLHRTYQTVRCHAEYHELNTTDNCCN